MQIILKNRENEETEWFCVQNTRKIGIEKNLKIAFILTRSLGGVVPIVCIVSDNNRFLLDVKENSLVENGIAFVTERLSREIDLAKKCQTQKTGLVKEVVRQSPVLTSQSNTVTDGSNKTSKTKRQNRSHTDNLTNTTIDVKVLLSRFNSSDNLPSSRVYVNDEAKYCVGDLI